MGNTAHVIYARRKHAERSEQLPGERGCARHDLAAFPALSHRRQGRSVYPFAAALPGTSLTFRGASSHIRTRLATKNNSTRMKARS